MPQVASDGPYVSGFYSGNPSFSYPFINEIIPDKFTRKVVRIWKQRPPYLPAAANRTSYTNLLAVSQPAALAPWTVSSGTLTANAGVGPDGSATASRYVGAGDVAHQVSVTAGTYIISGWVKAYGATDQTFRLKLDATYSADFLADASWKRFTLTVSSVAAALSWQISAGAAAAAYDVLIFGAQLERASLAGPYISTTTSARTILSPDLDPGDALNPADPFAYLVREDEAAESALGNLSVPRLFSRIPPTQTRVSFLKISKPSLTGTFPQVFGNYRLFQPDATLLKYDAYTKQTVMSDTGPTTAFYPTGGTYTISFAGSTTTALAYNAAPATVQTALNALTPVSNRGGVVVSGTYNSAGGLVITFNSYAAGSAATGSLVSTTGSTVGASITSLNGAYTQGFAIYATGLDAASPALNTGSLVYTGSPTSNYAAQSGQTLTFIFSGPVILTGGTYTLTAYGQTTAAIAYNASQATVTAAITAALTTLSARGTIVVSALAFSNNINITITVYPSITSGTYTLTVFGQTTGALNYNDNAATIQAALNALTEVSTKRGGCVVTGTGYNSAVAGFYVGVGFTINFTNQLVTSSPSALTPSGCTVTPALGDSVGRIQSVTFAASIAVRSLSLPAHGLAATDALYLKTDATYTLVPNGFTLPDANTVQFNLAPGSTVASATAITEAGKRTKADYEPGSGTVRSNEITSFYLPGVTPGITTAADIAQPTDQGDGAPLLLAVFSGSPAINMSVGQIKAWDGSQILAQDLTTIAAADV